MSVIESSSLNAFVERNSINKAAFICNVNYIKMWNMVEDWVPIRIIQTNNTYSVWRAGKLLNTVKESTLQRRGIT